MNFDITAEQEMLRDTFARFLDENSSMVRVRAAMPSGFDPALWRGLAEMGALALRVPEGAGGMGLGLFDALLLMEEAGRTLVSGPLAEAVVAARVLGQLGESDVLGRALAGETIATIDFSGKKHSAVMGQQDIPILQHGLDTFHKEFFATTLSS